MEPLKVQTALIVLSASELSDLVEAAVARALDQYVASQPPPAQLLKSAAMAERLDISESQLAILCRDGLPHIVAGDRVRRFEVDRVLAWLRERGR